MGLESLPTRSFGNFVGIYEPIHAPKAMKWPLNELHYTGWAHLISSLPHSDSILAYYCRSRDFSLHCCPCFRLTAPGLCCRVAKNTLLMDTAAVSIRGMNYWQETVFLNYGLFILGRSLLHLLPFVFYIHSTSSARRLQKRPALSRRPVLHRSSLRTRRRPKPASSKWQPFCVSMYVIHIPLL